MITLGVLVCLFIVLFIKLFQSNRSYPPGPLRLPLIGSLWRIGFKLSHNTFMEMTKQYGNIFTLWLGAKAVVVVSGFEAVKEGLINHSENFVDRPQTIFFTDLVRAKGITFSNGHTWKQQRKFGLATMRKLGLGKKGVEHQIKEEAHRLVETLSCANGQPIDPSLLIRNSVSNVLCTLAFGHRFSVHDEEFLKLTEAIDLNIKFIRSLFYLMSEVFPWLMNCLPGPHKKVISSRNIVLSFIRKEIEKHKERPALHEPQDYIDFYLLQMAKSKNDPNSTYDEENMAQSIFDLFIAGTITTVSTLQWGLLLMANHPEIQEKVYKEMEDVLGSSQSFSHQEVKKLPYTNAVIHEIQRSQYVLLFGIPRECVKDVNMFGFLIPKGTILVPDISSVLRDPKRWATPQEFNPNHFLDKDGNFVDREEFLPFGAGARVCLGQQLARIELFIIFTSLLKAFTFQAPEGVKLLNKEPVTGLILHPLPYKLCAVSRLGNYKNN